ncbi:MAG: M20 family peptidase [Salinibacter sp.]|uniref:M20 family peptidase n=1 Tax=Salinibacter sp. TaxID=2065818 RepID=UPI002FC36718
MMKRGLIAGTLLLAGLAAAVLVRTLQMSYEPSGVNPVEPPRVDEAAAVDRLSAAVQIPTVSYQDSSDMNHEAFEGFVDFMERSYPRIHGRLERERVGRNGYTLLYRWAGRDTTQDPVMLMGHYDVVPVEEGTRQEWEHAPFGGERTNGYLWGRGTLDDKSGTLSAFEAVEYLLGTGYQPEQTVYLAAHHDEEIGGRRGAAEVAKLLKERDESLDFVVDEGMPVAEEILQGIESPLAMIGVAEKGSLTLRLEVVREGGHASMPPRQTAIGELASAVHELKENPMPAQFGDLLQRTFEPISAELPFVYRMGLSNLWLFGPLIKRRLAQVPHTNAAMRTTIAPTIFRAGMKTNVLPAHAEATINFRIHPQDSVEAVVDHVRSTIDNPTVEVHRLDGAREASFVSDLDKQAYQQLKRSIWETFGEIPVAPSMFVAATDSRHFHDLTRDIYRFRPIRARPSDRTRLHGTDERIRIDNYLEMIHFQIRLLRNTTS